MDRRERYDNPTETLLAAMEGSQAALWTALPGIVDSFDATKMTCSVQPSIQARVRSKDGTTPPVDGAVLDVDPWWWVTLPLLVDVPVVFPGGGGWSMTFPIAKGDEALVVFSARCIDDWWQSGNVGIQADLRMHDLSDGFAIVGPRSQPHVLNPAVSAAAAVIRKNDNSVRIEVGAGGADVNIVTTGKVAVTANEADVTAAAIKLGNGGALLKLLNDNFKTWATTHVHSGVQAGAGVTGAPTVAPDATMETAVVTAQ